MEPEGEMEVRGCLGGVQWGGRVMGEGLSLISVAHVMMFVLFALLSNHQYCINTFEAYMFYTSHALVEKRMSSFRFQTNWDQVCETFDDMNLREELQRGIYAYG